MSSSDEEATAVGGAAATTQRSNARLLELKSLRASTKGNITRIKNLLAKKGAVLAVEELECRLGILESYFKQVLAVQANINKISPESDRLANATLAGEIEELYVSTKLSTMTFIGKRRSSVADVTLAHNNSIAAPTSRLRREIKLPKFDGKYAESPKFMALFTKMVHQGETLDNSGRFLILKDSLGERALSAIADFDETDDNYPNALQRLKLCLHKKSLMFEEHIGALFEMPKVDKAII